MLFADPALAAALTARPAGALVHVPNRVGGERGKLTVREALAGHEFTVDEELQLYAGLPVVAELGAPTLGPSDERPQVLAWLGLPRRRGSFVGRVEGLLVRLEFASGRDRELHEIPAMGNPTYVVRIGRT
jgi:hypothetical protein